MSRYSEIRGDCRKSGGGVKRYANGGAVMGSGKSAGNAKTVINVVVPPSTSGAPAGPLAGGMGGPAPGSPPAPVPPVAANAALGQMGSPPMLANGGRVKAGAATGVHRLQMQKKKGK